MHKALVFALLTFLSVLLLRISVNAQNSALQLPQKYVRAVEKKVNELTTSLDQKSAQYLSRFQKAEAKLLRKVAKKDSTKTTQLLAQSKAKYQQLEQTLKSNSSLEEYLPSLDTLVTSLKFLGQHQQYLTKGKDVQEDLTKVLAKVDNLKTSLAKAETVNQFLRERKAQLAAHLQGLPLAKDFKRLHTQAYYYKAQVDEYKALLKDKSKWEKKALELLIKTEAFQSFMRKHSQLASLFRLPGREKSSLATLEGLQTRAQVTSLLQERFGSDPAAIAQLRDNVQAAQGQLASLKNKAESLKNGSMGNSKGDLSQPNFKPNGQKTKSFLKRLEVGTNIQSQKARWMFPITSDLGLSLGYKLNDKSIIGLGGSYKLGLGNGWQDLSISHQGVGIRSFLEYQLKGSFFLSGGYERNFRNQIQSVDALKDRSAWQESGLLGLTKKYQVSKKLRGNMQLLWDFLSHQQVPRTQAVLFRIGYNLK